MQTIVIFPLTTADIYSDAIRQQTERASSVELTLEDTMPGKPPRGSVFLSRCVVVILPQGRVQNIVMSMFVCLSACSHISETCSHTYHIFVHVACDQWPWLGSFLLVLQYVMYFRFCG